jgi:hypothetical protein
VFQEKLAGGVEPWYTPSRYQLLHEVPEAGANLTVTVPDTVAPFAGELIETPAQARLMLVAENTIAKKDMDMALFARSRKDIDLPLEVPRARGNALPEARTYVHLSAIMF